MLIYIITKCGKILKDEVIQYLLERVALTEKKNNYIYRCPSSKTSNQDILRELNETTHEFRFLYYESMDKWMILPEIARYKIIQALKDPLNQGAPLNEILTNIMIDDQLHK